MYYHCKLVSDQYIEPCGFSGSLPLLFVMFSLLFLLYCGK